MLYNLQGCSRDTDCDSVSEEIQTMAKFDHGKTSTTRIRLLHVGKLELVRPLLTLNINTEEQVRKTVSISTAVLTVMPPEH